MDGQKGGDGPREERMGRNASRKPPSGKVREMRKNGSKAC